METNPQLSIASGPATENIEDEANAYFQKIYDSKMSVADVVSMLLRFKSSNSRREKEIYGCMIHNLFDEFRFFHKYPDKELSITGRLFGTLIYHELIGNYGVDTALRYVLEVTNHFHLFDNSI